MTFCNPIADSIWYEGKVINFVKGCAFCWSISVRKNDFIANNVHTSTLGNLQCESGYGEIFKFFDTCVTLKP